MYQILHRALKFEEENRDLRKRLETKGVEVNNEDKSGENKKDE